MPTTRNVNAFAPSTVAHAEWQASTDGRKKEPTPVSSKAHPSRHVPSSTQVAVGAEENDGDGLGLIVVVGAADGCRDGDRLGKSVESHRPPTIAFSKE